MARMEWARRKEILEQGNNSPQHTIVHKSNTTLSLVNVRESTMRYNPSRPKQTHGLPYTGRLGSTALSLVRFDVLLCPRPPLLLVRGR